jgi:hypothetical protein
VNNYDSISETSKTIGSVALALITLSMPFIMVACVAWGIYDALNGNTVKSNSRSSYDSYKYRD